MTKLKDETAQLEREKREALETTDSYFESMIEQFRTELECHRRMMHGEARERLAGRLAQIDEEIKSGDCVNSIYFSYFLYYLLYYYFIKLCKNEDYFELKN